MILHPAKTKSMPLATRQKHHFRPLHLNLSLKHSHIEQIHEHRHLGVVADGKFSWRPHITTPCKTISKIMYLFSQLIHCGQPKRKLFYLTGASSVWEGCSDILFSKLESLHTHTHARARAALSMTLKTKI